ncbi:MAG: hypothetical protein WDM81_20320 [Rhizomicrobium sp.]
MRYLIDGVAAVLFVVSTGLLFSETVRARRILFILVGVVTLASSYVIAKDVLDATVGHRMHHRRAVVAASTAAPAPDANDFSATDALLEQIYGTTESALNRIVRAGTKQSTASVSSDTVVDVIVGLSLAALGVLSQLFSSLYRRLFGAEA